MAVDDPRVVEIVAAYRAASGDPDQMPWLSVLPWKETDVWAQIVHALISSADRYRRAVGVDLMVCGVDSTAVPSLVTRLVSLSTMEADGVVLVAVVRALRRVGGRRGVRAIARLADCDSALVRAQVAYSLSIEADGQDGASVRRVLLVLGRDEDDGTREGAVFALARQSRSIDSRVVDLLWERALDHDRRVRSEAIAGLVLRGAPSLHDELFEMISANDDDDFDQGALVQAAGATGETRFLSPLETYLDAEVRRGASFGELYLIRDAIAELRAALAR